MSEPFRTDAKQLSQSLNKLLFLVNATSEDRNFLRSPQSRKYRVINLLQST